MMAFMPPLAFVSIMSTPSVRVGLGTPTAIS
jgi:hypothetical protein